MDSSGKSFLELATKLSGRISDVYDKYDKGDTTEKELSRIIFQSTQTLTIEAIYQVYDKKKVLNEYALFILTIVEKLISDKNAYTYQSFNHENYKTASRVISLMYILAAFLIRTEEIEDANSLLRIKMRDTMTEHYLPRAVYTLSARANVKFEKSGWAISIAKDIFQSNKKIRIIFYNNEELFIDLVSQVDFLQYYAEYKMSDGDIYSGYPNFLYVKKKRVMPLIEKIVESEHNQEQMKDLVGQLSGITAGDLFMNNQWSYHD